MAVVGAGPAIAHPHDHGGVTRTVEGYGVGSLSAPDSELGVLITLFDPPDRDAHAGVEIFGSTATSYYECFEGPSIEADLDRLRDADAWGRTRLLCGGPDLPRDVTAFVKVDLDWDRAGPVVRDRFPQGECTVRTAMRPADVTGRVTVRIPALGVKARLTEGVGDLRRTTTVCPD
jgi:hypothetical protein